MPQASDRERMFGRDRELATLSAALDEALAGTGRLMLIGGEPGIGKTRLAEALSELAEARAVPVAWGRFPELAGAPPYWGWTQLLRSLLALRPTVTVDQDLARGPAQLARILPELTPGHKKQRPFAVGAIAAAESFALHEAVTSLLRASASQLGLVLILDDLHAADPASVTLFSHLGRVVASLRALLVATHRDSERDLGPQLRSALAELGRERSTLRIQVVGLDAVAVREHLVDVMDQAVSSITAGTVRDRTEGNPFFAGELGRLLADRARLLDDPLVATAVPPGVRDIVTWRLQQLPETARSVLEVAALVGRNIHVDVIAAACESSAEHVLESLEPAVTAGTLVRDEGDRLRFSHALVVDALRETLPVARRASLHLQVAIAIESTRGASLDDWLPALAAHWAGAPRTEHSARRALDTARRAAQLASARLGHSDAASLWRIALDSADAARVSAAERAEVLVGLAGSLYRCGEVRASLDVCLQAAAAADAAERADLFAAAALIVEGTGELEWAPTLVRLASDALVRVGNDDLSLRARLNGQLGSCLHFTSAPGRRERAQAATSTAVALAEQSGDDAALYAALRSRQITNSAPDGIEEREATAARMLELGTATGNPWAEFWGRLWLVDAHFQRGQLDYAEAGLAALEPVVERLQWPVARWHVLRTRAAMAQARARFADALELITASADVLAGTGLPRARVVTLSFLEVQSDLVGPIAGNAERLAQLTEWSNRGELGPLVRLLLTLLRERNLDEARTQYHRLTPVAQWDPPDYLLSVNAAYRIQIGIALGLRGDVEFFMTRLLPFAHWQVVAGAGTVATQGSGWRYVGLAEAFLGRLDDAVEHLGQAVEDNRRCGVVAFAVVAQQDLAETLLKRGAGGDVERSRTLAAGALDQAQLFGMQPMVDRARAHLSGLPVRYGKTDELTRRELEVARLVAEGLTNRQLAVRLGITERTAEAHLDHIRSKLGFASRAQVAGWIAVRERRAGAQ